MLRLQYVAHKFWGDRRGQDLVEYALISGLIAVVVAGFLPPNVMPAISTIFSKIVSGLSWNAS
jgi:Flp pilus assembly pilin Flp